MRILCVLLIGGFFVLMLSGVLLRQAFSLGSVTLQDLSGYCFAVLVLLSVPVAFAANRHVRVDILSNWWSPQASRRLQWTGYWIFLVPVCLLVIIHAFPGLVFSWSVRESSTEPEGLGGYFLVKSVLPFSFLWLVLQGFVHLYRSSSNVEDGSK